MRVGEKLGHSQGDIEGSVRRLRVLSNEFQTFHKINRVRATEASTEARRILSELFLFFRNGQDYGRIPRDVTPPRYMAVIANDLAPAVAQRMVNAQEVERAHANTDTRASFRDALNKIAHQDTNMAGYRVDGAHHLIILTGREDEAGIRRWVAEIDVALFCDYCEGILEQTAA